MSDLSIVSKAGAESIKKSLETLNDQSKYIKDLNSSVQRKDSLNLALVMTLKRSLADVNDDDVTVEVKKELCISQFLIKCFSNRVAQLSIQKLKQF